MLLKNICTDRKYDITQYQNKQYKITKFNLNDQNGFYLCFLFKLPLIFKPYIFQQ